MFDRPGQLKSVGSSYVRYRTDKNLAFCLKFFETGSKEFAVISESFDPRTLSKMEIALDRACLILPAESDKHRIRRIIAGKILECAHRGDKTLSGLTAAGYAAATQLGDTQ